MYFIDIRNLPQELAGGIGQLVGEYPLSLEKRAQAREIVFCQEQDLSGQGGLNVSRKGKKVTVKYGRKTDAFRALGRLLGESEEGREGKGFEETPRFDILGVQLESSRNGVMTTDNVKAFLRRLALMGINMVMLYTEDTYEVPGQPFFGYLRGRYTGKELRELDDYADALGVEMLPCIQTLGHLGQVLQWREAYRDVTDTGSILLAGEEKTYELLEQMITAASAPYRSKRIYVGMDEAEALGSGQYKRLHGERRPFDIMNEHLTGVVQICERLGLKPMMYSDMYFRLGSKTGVYYDLDAEIPLDVVRDIPEGVGLVYWDYYHTDSSFYEKFIDLHQELGRVVAVATGAWTWHHFWAALPFAYSVIRPCMQACKAKGVREAFITVWGDDGMENDVYSALPAIQFFAEFGYGDKVEKELLEANFRGSCGGDLEAYNLASRIDLLPGREEGKQNVSDTSRWLLWDDPLIGLCEPLQEDQSFREHYANLAKSLARAIGKDQASQRLRFPAQIARTLAIKCDCRKNLVAAYRSNDREKLAELKEKEVKPLLREVKKLWKIHREMWLATYKPFGLEVIEIRYGGLMTRLESLISRLEDYLQGDIERIPEFETELLNFQKGNVHEPYFVGSYRRIATPSRIF